MESGLFPNVNATSITADSFTVDGIALETRYGNTIYVAENGNNAKTGTHPQDPVATIEKALQIATAGDTVHIIPNISKKDISSLQE